MVLWVILAGEGDGDSQCVSALQALPFSQSSSICLFLSILAFGILLLKIV